MAINKKPIIKTKFFRQVCNIVFNIVGRKIVVVGLIKNNNEWNLQNLLVPFIVISKM